MAYVIKTIKGRRYRYQQTSRRVNGKVKTTSVYLGPVDPVYGGHASPIRPKGPARPERIGFLRANLGGRNGLPDDDEMLAQFNAKIERDEAKHNAGMDKLHTDFGLKMPSYSPAGQVAPVERAPMEVVAPAEHAAHSAPPDDAKDDAIPDSDPSPAV